MKVLVDRLSATPAPLEFEATPEWFRERTETATSAEEILAEPVAISLEASLIGADLLIEGRAEGHLELACGRCLKRYRAPIREPFRLVLEPAGARVPADPEGAESLAGDGLYLSDELEAGWFRGPEIRLDRFVAELIALAIPTWPVCREDCSGLCPHCGIDPKRTSL